MATASASALATATAKAKGRAQATATASTRRRARVKAYFRAWHLAKDRARHRARYAATVHSRHDAYVKAKAKAVTKARRKAYARAKHRAVRLARLRRIDPQDPTTWIRYAPRHVTPPVGARFNNPYAGFTKRRTLLAQVIHAIKSSPGYRLTRDPDTGKRLTCPRNPKYYPSEIKIAVYSIADRRFGAHLLP